MIRQRFLLNDLDAPTAASRRITWRRRRTTIIAGRKSRLTTCGQFRVDELSMIEGVAIERDEHGRPKRFFHALRRVERPAGNFGWWLVSRHRSERAARLACERAARQSRQAEPHIHVGSTGRTRRPQRQLP